MAASVKFQSIGTVQLSTAQLLLYWCCITFKQPLGGIEKVENIHPWMILIRSLWLKKTSISRYVTSVRQEFNSQLKVVFRWHIEVLVTLLLFLIFLTLNSDLRGNCFSLLFSLMLFFINVISSIIQWKLLLVSFRYNFLFVVPFSSLNWNPAIWFEKLCLPKLYEWKMHHCSA